MAVAEWDRHVVDVGLGAGVGDGAADLFAADGVGAVEDDDLERVVVVALFGCGGFEEVADDGLVGVAADAGVLEVDDDGVEVFELVVGGAFVAVVGAVEGGYVKACGGVGFGGEVFGVLRAEDAVLGGEEGGELCVGEGSGEVGVEDVYGAAVVGVEAGLVGEEAEAELVVVGLGEVGEGGEVGGFEDVDAGLGRLFGVRLSRKLVAGTQQ